MNILILGGRRYLGPRLIKRLLELGHEPTLFNRGQTRAPLPVKAELKEIRGDRTVLEDLKSAVQGESFDAIIDMLAFNAHDAELAVSAFRDKVERYIVISSVACYGRLTTVPANEEHPYVEDRTAFPGGANEYATGKRDVEQVLFQGYEEHQFPVTVIRPSVSYGFGRLTSIWGYSTRHVARIRAGKPVIVPDTGEGLIQPVHIDDEAEIVAKCLTNNTVVGEAFNCAGPAAVPLWQYFRLHGEVMDREVDIVELPSEFLAGFDPILCARAAQNLIFNHAYDVSKIEKQLNFRHRYSLSEGLRDTIEFLDEWDLVETTNGDDPDDWLIDGYGNLVSGSLKEQGIRLRQAKGYEPPPRSPLVTWAPNHYVPR